MKSPSTNVLITPKTDSVSGLSALVITQSPCADWSASTPIAVTFFSQAASIAPRPQSPATWNTTSEPCEIWSSAISLHLAASLKSFEYAFRSLTFGFVAFTAAWKPAIQLSTGGILMPPTVETVLVFVVSAATMPAR